MKKFDRLPIEDRKNEIKTAALKLFNDKGFSATTMENIIEAVSLSKGGVYRIYPSTSLILSDLMIDGMHLRNAYYVTCANEMMANKQVVNLEMIVDMIIDSLLIHPEYSKIYVEFLWEKKRNATLQSLYLEVCERSLDDTLKMINELNIKISKETLSTLTELMNAAILALHILDLNDDFIKHKPLISKMMIDLLKNN